MVKPHKFVGLTFYTRDMIALTVVIVLAFFIWRGQTTQGHIISEGHQAHDYLCYQKTVVIPQRIKSTKDYLADIEAGRRAPLPGITKADFQQSIKRDEASLKALALVTC